MVQRQKEAFNNSNFLYKSLIYYNIDSNDNTIEEFLDDVDEDGRVLGDANNYYMLDTIWTSGRRGVPKLVILIL